MKWFLRHLFYWLGGTFVAFCVILISISITDIVSLNGTPFQRFAANLNNHMAWPGDQLYRILPGAAGPVYFAAAVVFWGLLFGEIALLAKRILRL